MANNFMLKLLIIFFGCLNFSGVGAQISKKPDVASSALQQDGYQASTLLTFTINKADTPDTRAQFDANDDDLAEVENAEVLSDVEEDDDDDESPANELMNVNATNFGDVAMSSASNGGERLKVRLVRYHKADCEKKRHPHKGKKLKEGKCYKLHKNHFKSYEFYFGKKKKEDKKGKDDDDDDDSEEDTSKGCRVMIFFDKKCKDEASSTNAADSCKDIGEEGVDDDDGDDDDDKDKKLRARDLMVKRDKGPKYKSAKFLCDGVDTSENTTKTETEDDYSVTTTVSSQPVHVTDPTGSSSKSYTPSSITATRSSKSATHLSKSGSEEPTTTSEPVGEKDPDDDDDDDDKEDEDTEDEKEDDDREDEKEDDDEDKEPSSTASSTTKTKKHKTKSYTSKKHTKTKKHHTKTQSQTVATESAQAASDAPSP